MPLNQPTNIFPSSFAGAGGGTIDATQPLTVSWQVNGSSAMTAYQIQIFENTTVSRKVYDSGKVNLSTPFYGTAYNEVTHTYQTQFFTVTLPASALSGLSNGFASGYKMVLTQWWNGGSVQQLSPSFFLTRNTPNITINAFPTPITGRTGAFTATYTQAQGDTLDWFRWMLAVEGQEESPLEDTGNIYGTEDIQVSYDGLFTGTTYVVRVMIQTENGIQADTGWVPFQVEYEVSDMQGYVTACPSPVEGVALQWPLVSYIQGTANGPYSISGGDLILPAGSTIQWEERNGASLDIQTPWSLAWSGEVPGTGTAPVWTVEGGGHTLTFNIEPGLVSLLLDGNSIFEEQISGIGAGVPWRFVLTPREAHLYYATQTGGLFPATTLYPLPTLYPVAPVQVWKKVTEPLTWVQPDIERITLHGEQVCHWMTVIAGEVSGARLNSLLMDLSYEPVWELDTRFLSGFEGTGLNAGNITPVGDTITGAALYRQKAGESKLSLVANTDISTTSLIDEGFRNQTTYTYYLFVLGANTYVSAPLISNAITPRFWNWTVLDCTLDGTTGHYHLQAAHLFRNSVSTDSISNNNAPNLLQNFTPYPLRQPTSYNYNSSTLTGYIGRVDMGANQYIDTADMARQLWDLSVKVSPKFLRDRKGNLWKIETSAPVTMQTGDNQAPQPYFGSLPWAEIGPSEGVSILCEEGDGAWGDVAGTQPETTEQAQIVATAPPGSVVTITGPDGQTMLVQEAYPAVRYKPPFYGMYTVTATFNGATATTSVNVAETVTYYVGLKPATFAATVIVVAETGASVTLSGNGFSQTKVVS